MYQLNDSRFVGNKKMLPQTLILPGLRRRCPPVFLIKYRFDRVHQQMAFFHYIPSCWTVDFSFMKLHQLV